jgi:hypothetical protein
MIMMIQALGSAHLLAMTSNWGWRFLIAFFSTEKNEKRVLTSSPFFSIWETLHPMGTMMKISPGIFGWYYYYFFVMVYPFGMG